MCQSEKHNYLLEKVAIGNNHFLKTSDIIV